jgi:hypothetical protein
LYIFVMLFFKFFLGPVKLLNTTAPDAFAPVFSLGWSVLADNLRIPTVHQAQLAPAPGAGAWPIVVFSHGMGCNRFAYSKVHLCCACVVHSL